LPTTNPLELRSNNNCKLPLWVIKKNKIKRPINGKNAIAWNNKSV